MEYLDVLDASGNPTGRRKTKLDVHRDGDWHRTVHVWLINPKGELLIQQRSPDKDSYPGQWDISAAGHISAGEDSITAALRESREELGLEAERGDFNFLFTVIQQAILNNGAYINNEFSDVYLLKINSRISELRLQKEEVSAAKWISCGDLEEAIRNKGEDFVPHSEEYARLFLELSLKKS